jgi:hypothetical protein
MKRNLLGLFAIVMAVVFSSFTARNMDTVYFIYDGVGVEKDLDSYTLQPNSPGQLPGTDILAWFRGEVGDIDAPTEPEFEDAFELIDGNKNGTDNDQLSDETTEDSDFEKRAED